MKQSKKTSQGPGRPKSNGKFLLQQQGLITNPLQSHENVLVEFITQYPMHLKCITNIMKQIDKNCNINFAFTKDHMYMWVRDQDQQYNCYMQFSCIHMLSYFIDPKYLFVKFDIPVYHLQNTFNFYNRSSVKTELRVVDQNAPVFKIDSHKAENKNVQCITTINPININPSNSCLLQTETFLEKVVRTEESKKKLQSMSKMEKMQHVLQSNKLFSGCFFGEYAEQKIYSFSFSNPDMRKFITEIQKDCSKIQIRRENDKQNPLHKIIILEAKLPGSSSVKQLHGLYNKFTNYKQYDNEVSKNTPDDVIFELGTGTLKQITSNNPGNIITFVLLGTKQIILKIKDGFSLYKFELNCI